jgi:hypothetical protein
LKKINHMQMWVLSRKGYRRQNFPFLAELEELIEERPIDCSSEQLPAEMHRTRPDYSGCQASAFHCLLFQWYIDLAHPDLATCEFLKNLQRKALTLS